MDSEMENKDWLNEYEKLKQVSPANPFTVPEGYFDSLGERIVAYKNFSDWKSNQPLHGFTVPENYFDELASNIQSRIIIESQIDEKETGFTVPENYFDELASNIQSRINIESYIEEKEIGFTIPENYFDELASNIQSRINIESHIEEKETGFTVPESYFDELTSNIQSRINVESRLQESEAGFLVPENYFENLQSQIQARIAVDEFVKSSEEVFAVPENYFEELNEQILNKTINANQVRKPGIVRKMYTSTVFKYATAACFALVVGGGVLLMKITSPTYVHNHSFLHKELSSVTVDELKDYLQTSVDEEETEHIVLTEGNPVDNEKLQNALQKYANGVK